MASWALVHVPWMSLRRTRLRCESFTKSLLRPKNHFTASFQLSRDSPAVEALKKHPYPSNVLDSSVFEERSEEYDSIAGKSLRSVSEVPKSSIQTLVHLVECRNYEAAEQVRAELLQMGIEIPLDTGYEQAAIAALHSSNHENHATSFAHWFSLIPMACDSKSRSFHTICQLLLYKSLQPNLPLILRFGLICASKGYARKVFRRVMPFIIQFAHPSVSATFMDEFEKLAVGCHRERPRKTRRMLKSFRGLAIRTHCLAGRPEEAVRIFQASRAGNIPVSHFSVSLLAQTLEKNLDTTNLKIVMHLCRRPLYYPLNHISLSQDRQANAVLPAIPDLSQTTSLALKVRILKRSLVSRRPPTANALANFISEYQAAGRNRSLVMLRRKVFRHSHKSISLWLAAEMVYHMGRKQYDMVVVIFHTHFHLIGVPQDQILRRLESSSIQKRLRSGRDELPFTIVACRYPMTDKIFPSSTHTAILWDALVYLSRGEELENLYNQLLHFARLGHGTILSADQPSPPLQPAPSFSLTPPPLQTIDEVHFTPFVRAFKRRRGPARAFELLHDMVNLGLRPNHYHYAILAAEFAGTGDVDRSMSLLDRMEAVGPMALPAPNIVTYTNILRGFVNARCIDAALDVEKRMVKNLGYVPGSNPQTDRVRSMLQSLLEEQSPTTLLSA